MALARSILLVLAWVVLAGPSVCASVDEGVPAQETKSPLDVARERWSRLSPEDKERLRGAYARYLESLGGDPREAGIRIEHEDAARSRRLEEARRRWNGFSPEEQARFRRRYEEYVSLPPVERERIDERARKMEEIQSQVESRLSDSARAKMRSLSPEKRRELVQELVHAEIEARSSLLRPSIPQPLIARLDELPPEERERALERFKHDHRDRISRAAVRSLGKTLGLDQPEIVRRLDLPVDERVALVLEMQRDVELRDVREHGLPAGLTPEQWDAMEALPPEQFYREMSEFRRQLGERHERGARRQAERAHRDAVARLRRLLTPTPEERLELADLPPRKRRAEIARRVRVRALEHAEATGLVTGERLERLEAMPDGQVHEVLFELLREEQRRFRPRPREPGRLPPRDGEPERLPPRPGEPDRDRNRRPGRR